MMFELTGFLFDNEYTAFIMEEKRTETETVFYQYGRRKSDRLPGVIVKPDGSTYIRAGDLEKLNRKANNLSMLMDSASSIMAEMGLDNLLVLIMDSVTRVMQADRSTLFLIDDHAEQIWSRVAQGSDEIRIPLGKGIAGHVALTGDTINIPDAYSDERFNPDFDKQSGYKTKSILCMPVHSPQGAIIGTIQVLNKLDETIFTRDDESLLAAFASLAGISLANAKAYEELEKERDSLEIRVQERTRDLEEARQKSDELLLNILPEDVAEELKSDGHSKPQSFEEVSVLFTDFKGFTAVAEKVSPRDLVKELDNCFYYFDEVIERFGLEKIKTIGDSYMCVGGLPRKNKSHAIETVLAALEIQNFMDSMREIKQSVNEPFWELRLGIHSGPVIAGVVGKKKFAYDIWGDTVNTASRMESSGSVGRVNISSDTYALIEPYFNCEYRGAVEAKNKGNIDMYYVNSIHPDYAADDECKVPGKNLLGIIRERKNPAASH